jgi:hypothetical protein
MILETYIYKSAVLRMAVVVLSYSQHSLVLLGNNYHINRPNLNVFNHDDGRWNDIQHQEIWASFNSYIFKNLHI